MIMSYNLLCVVISLVGEVDSVVQCCTVLYSVVQCCTVLYSVVQCCTVLYSAVQCCY